jgi:Cu+-exporting ATPase
MRGAGFVQILLVLVVIGVVTVIALRLYQRTAPTLPAGTGRAGHPARAVLDRVELRVEGLTSDSDALQVTEALRRVPGVAGASCDAATGRASVTFSPTQTNPDELLAAVSRAGFRASR